MAFTRDWDEAAPAGSDGASSGDDEIRYLKVEISDRLKNMLYGLIAGENTLAQHFQYLQLYEQASVAQPSAAFGRLYCKAVSGKCELFWQDEDGDEIQLTTGGKWNGAVLANDSVDSAHYAAASIDNEHLADNAVDTEELAADAVDGTKIADDAVDSEHIVDGSIDPVHIANLAPDSISGEGWGSDSEGYCNFGNGLQMRWGTTSCANGNNTLTFATAFDNHCFQIIASYGSGTPEGDSVTATSLSKTGCTLYNSAGATLTVRWFAIGY